MSMTEGGLIKWDAPYKLKHLTYEFFFSLSIEFYLEQINTLLLDPRRLGTFQKEYSNIIKKFIKHPLEKFKRKNFEAGFK